VTTFDEARLRSVLEHALASPHPDADVLMDEGRRATRWPEASVAVEEWMRGRCTPAVADAASAFLIGWRLGGAPPSESLVLALVDLVEQLGLEELGPAAANTAVLALAPVPVEFTGSLADRASRLLREADRERNALALQAGARAALDELFHERAPRPH
jgi:hypothetical protein